MESPFPSRAELDPPEQTPHVCLLACSPHPDGSTDAAARLLEQALLSRGAIVDRISLREYAIHPCIGCDKCVRTSECTFEADDMKELNRTFPRPMRSSSSRRSIILTSTPSSRRSSTAFTPTMKR